MGNRSERKWKRSRLINRASSSLYIPTHGSSACALTLCYANATQTMVLRLYAKPKRHRDVRVPIHCPTHEHRNKRQPRNQRSSPPSLCNVKPIMPSSFSHYAIPFHILHVQSHTLAQPQFMRSVFTVWFSSLSIMSSRGSVSRAVEVVVGDRRPYHSGQSPQRMALR